MSAQPASLGRLSRYRACLERRLSSPLGALILVLVAVVSVQLGGAFAKRLLPLVGAPGATALRLFFATLIVCGLVRPWRRRLQPAGRAALLGYGLGMGAMNLCFYESLRTVPLGLAVALEFTGPLMLAVAGTRRAIDGVWVALAGLGLLLLAPIDGQRLIDPQGALLALVAGGFWTVYMVAGKRAGAQHGAGTAAWGMLIAAVLVIPVGIADAGVHLLAPAVLPVALGVAILSSALPYSLEMAALQRIPVRAFGVLMSLEPAFGALFGWLVLDESLDLRQSLAIAAIIAASLGTTLTAHEDLADVAA